MKDSFRDGAERLPRPDGSRLLAILGLLSLALAAVVFVVVRS